MNSVRRPAGCSIFFRLALAIWIGTAVAPMSRAQTPTIGRAGVVNAASYSATPVAAGSPAVLWGENLGPATPEFVVPPLPTTLAGTTVRMNGIAVPLFFVSSSQINFQVPWELAGQSAASVTVTTASGTSAPVNVNLATFGPALFTISATGTGEGVVFHENFSFVSASNPAVRGETVVILGTGLGPVTNQPANGVINPANSATTTQPTVLIGGVAAEVSLAGLSTHERRSGFYDIQVKVPDNPLLGNATPVTISIGGVPSNTVSMAIRADAAPALSVSPSSLSLDATAGSGTLRRTIEVRNTGGGTLNWGASVAILNGSGWIALSPAQGTATLAASANLNVDVNPGALAAGTYQALVTVRDTGSGTTATIPVAMVVSGSVARLQLSQSVVSFTAVQGGPAPPAQTLSVTNAGSGNMIWGVSVPSNPAFNVPSPTSGSATAGTAGSTVSFSVNPSGLPPGLYLDLFQVTAPGTAAHPQAVLGLLQVVAPAAADKAQLSPTGMVFVATQGGTAPAAQSLGISNTGGGSLNFSLQGSTRKPGAPPIDWLSVTPASGSVSNAPATAQVSVNPAGLGAGIYHGEVVAVFSGGAPQLVDVALVVTPPATGPARELPRANACTAATLDLVARTIGSRGLNLAVSYPNTLIASVFDNCGSAVNDAEVLANIEGLSIPLQSIGNGQYSGSWTPNRASAAVPISLGATHRTLGAVQRTYSVATIPGAETLPTLLANGVVEGAGFTPRRPLAPGSIVSLFGEGFAPELSSAETLPLPRSLGGVQVKIAGENAPLYFASPTQINAQVPFTAQPGEKISVVVTAGGKLTAPQTYQVAPTQPGVFQSGGLAAALDSQFRKITPSNPARAGDTIQIFANGLGIVDRQVQTGEGSPDFSTVLKPVTAEIGGAQAPVVYQGLAPGFVGLYQVNVQLPANVPTGDAVPVVLRQDGISSNPDLPVSIPIH